MTGEPTWAVTSSARLFVIFDIAGSSAIFAMVLRFLLRQMLLIDGYAAIGTILFCASDRRAGKPASDHGTAHPS